MRKLGLMIVFLILFIPAVNAADIKEMDIDITLNNDRSATWIVSLVYEENVTRSDYFVLQNILNEEVYIGGTRISCTVFREKIGNSILCENILTDNITYIFRTPNSINFLEDFMRFGYRIPITQTIDNVQLTARLPLGTALVERSRLAGTGLSPFEPASGKEGSDGRIIFLSWGIEQPVLGEPIDISLIFEELAIAEQQIVQFVVIAVLIIIVIGIGILFLNSRRHSIQGVLPVLTHGERKVMEILLRDKKPVDQRQIIKELDYSKSKVSRVIKDLENRGLVDKKTKGRTNLIKLRSKPAKETDKKEEKKQQDIVRKLLGKSKTDD